MVGDHHPPHPGWQLQAPWGSHPFRRRLRRLGGDSRALQEVFLPRIGTQLIGGGRAPRASSRRTGESDGSLPGDRISKHRGRLSRPPLTPSTSAAFPLLCGPGWRGTWGPDTGSDQGGLCRVWRPCWGPSGRTPDGCCAPRHSWEQSAAETCAGRAACRSRPGLSLSLRLCLGRSPPPLDPRPARGIPTPRSTKAAPPPDTPTKARGPRPAQLASSPKATAPKLSRWSPSIRSKAPGSGSPQLPPGSGVPSARLPPATACFGPPECQAGTYLSRPLRRAPSGRAPSAPAEPPSGPRRAGARLQPRSRWVLTRAALPRPPRRAAPSGLQPPSGGGGDCGRRRRGAVLTSPGIKKDFLLFLDLPQGPSGPGRPPQGQSPRPLN
jgi:hypothetical protein